MLRILAEARSPVVADADCPLILLIRHGQADVRTYLDTVSGETVSRVLFLRPNRELGRECLRRGGRSRVSTKGQGTAAPIREALRVRPACYCITSVLYRVRVSLGTS